VKLARGYVWGRTDTRIEITVKKSKDRQTYYGALDYQNQEFILREYSAGNSEKPVSSFRIYKQNVLGEKLDLGWSWLPNLTRQKMFGYRPKTS